MFRLDRAFSRGWLAPLAAFALLVLLTMPATARKVSTAGAELRTTGGTSQTVDGSVGATLKSGKWTLEIPAGAFSGVTTISMTELTTADGLPTVDLAIGNAALNNFRVPVWLSHKDKGNETCAIYWWDPVNQVWRAVPGQILALMDALGVEIKVPLYHFSTYSVRGTKAGW